MCRLRSVGASLLEKTVEIRTCDSFATHHVGGCADEALLRDGLRLALRALVDVAAFDTRRETPRVERNVFKIVMLVNAKQPSDLVTFMDALEATAAFKDLLPTDQTRLEDGTLSITLESTYVAGVLPSSKRTGKGVRP